MNIGLSMFLFEPLIRLSDSKGTEHLYITSISVTPSPIQLAVAPVFHLSQYDTLEGGQPVVRLSAPILTRPQTPAFTGSIEVDVTAEDLPTGDTRQSAEFGEHYLSIVQIYVQYLICINQFKSLVIMLNIVCISYLN